MSKMKRWKVEIARLCGEAYLRVKLSKKGEWVRFKDYEKSKGGLKDPAACIDALNIEVGDLSRRLRVAEEALRSSYKILSKGCCGSCEGDSKCLTCVIGQAKGILFVEACGGDVRE